MTARPELNSSPDGDLPRLSQTFTVCFLSAEPMHDNGTQTIKPEVVEPIMEVQETCREEANTSSSYSPSPRTVYTCNDGKVGRPGLFSFCSLFFMLRPFSHHFLEAPLTSCKEPGGGRMLSCGNPVFPPYSQQHVVIVKSPLAPLPSAGKQG